MYKITRAANRAKGDIIELVVDSISDAPTDVATGSICYCFEDGKFYIADFNGGWSAVGSPSSSGGGDSDEIINEGAWLHLEECSQSTGDTVANMVRYHLGGALNFLFDALEKINDKCEAEGYPTNGFNMYITNEDNIHHRFSIDEAREFYSNREFDADDMTIAFWEDDSYIDIPAGTSELHFEIYVYAQWGD